MMETPGERLARFLAHAGVASRRHAEQLIAQGRVRVNGAIVREQGSKIDPDRDRVEVDDEPVQPITEMIYIMLNKPEGYLSTVSDPEGRPTVLDLLPDRLQDMRLYPVGRLDNDTSGLILLTNDGDFALRLTHPRYEREKRYEALVEGQPSGAGVAGLRRGVTITEDDGRKYKTAPAKVETIRHEGNLSRMVLVIHEGRKRQVRRMLATVGLPVLELKRVAIGNLTLDDLPEGRWRSLTPDEVEALRSDPEAGGR